MYLIKFLIFVWHYCRKQIDNCSWNIHIMYQHLICHPTTMIHLNAGQNPTTIIQLKVGQNPTTIMQLKVGQNPTTIIQLKVGQNPTQQVSTIFHLYPV